MAASLINTRIKIANYGPERNRAALPLPAELAMVEPGCKVMGEFSAPKNLSLRYRFRQRNGKLKP
jgi:hypothetical protein